MSVDGTPLAHASPAHWQLAQEHDCDRRADDERQGHSDHLRGWQAFNQGLKDRHRSDLVDERGGLLEREPLPPALTLFAPLLALPINRQKKNIDMAQIKVGCASLKVCIVPQRFFAHLTDEAGFFESFLSSRFPRLAPFHRPAFRDHPALGFAGSEQQDAADASSSAE